MKQALLGWDAGHSFSGGPPDAALPAIVEYLEKLSLLYIMATGIN
jgi:hypothetical protein